MKKNVFSQSFRVLIVTLILLSVLFSREKSQKLMLAAILIWLASMAVTILVRLLRAKTVRKKPVKHPIRNGIVHILKLLEEDPDEKGGVLPLPKNERSTPTDTELAQMLQHIQLRISDKLKSAYADATWQWEKEPDLRNILAGETIRISVENMDKYTHADITFDRFGRIHVEPMTIGQFSPEANTAAPDKPEDAPQAEPDVVDVRVWYELIGQKILTEQITELNAKGHSKLTIKENGDITIRNQKNDVLRTTLDSFPAKNYWAELVSVLAEDQLTAKIAGDSLQISWI